MKHFLLSALLFLNVIGARAEVWTYSDCVEYAREHNISLMKSALTELSSEYDLEEAKAQWQPSLDFSTSHSYTNTPWGEGYRNSYNSTYGFNAGWTVWNGGVREKSIKQSRLRTEINKLNTGDIFRTLETDLLQVYINILYARESISIYEEAVKVSEVQEMRGKRLMEAGKMSRVDYSQLKSQYEQDKYNLVNAQTTYASRRMELKRLLELGIDAEITLADVEWDEAQVSAPLPPIDESYSMALANDLQLQSLALGMESSELDIAIAKAGRYPKISLNAGVGTGYFAPGMAFGTSLKQGFNENIGVSLSIPIFDNKKTSTAVNRARVAQLDAQLSIDQRQNDMAQTIENWYIDTQSAQSRYTAAVSQLESARLTDELTNERFNLGYINTLEMLTAHNSYIEAQYSLLQAKYMAMLGKKMIEFYRYASVSLP